MKKQNPRQLALDIINDVLQRGSFANLSLKYGLADSDAGDADKRLVSAIVYGTLDNLHRIDYILSQFIDLKKTSDLILNILRISVYQLLFLDKVPDYSVCSEAVSLAKMCTNQRMGNLVNAVLRNVIRKKDAIAYPADRTEYLSVMYSYPKWIVEMWSRDYGTDTAEKMLSYEVKRHLVSIRTNLLRLSRSTFEKALSPRVSVFERGRYADNCYYVNATGIADSELYQEGFYTIQSESSMLCALVANPAPGTVVLDSCSAPGGKAMYMAELMKGEGRLIACDLFEHKTELIDKNASRMGIDIIETKVADASIDVPAFHDLFDTVLADVPCSGLGVRSSKPDIKLQKTADGVGELNRLQKKILDNVSQYVKKGGTLVYSTCTINKNENERVVEQFLMKHKEFELIPIELNGFGERGKEGMLQIFPHMDDIDGFFIAKMRRKAN